MNKLVTYNEIMKEFPCYDPIEIGMPIDYEDTILNFINEYRHKVKKLNDIFWVIGDLDLLTKEQYQWFALGSAKMIQHLIKDESSIKALKIVESYLNGNATKKELEIFYDNAYAIYIASDVNDNNFPGTVFAAVSAAFNANILDYNFLYVASASANAKLKIQNKQIDLIIDILKTK
jgi:hypothetical protein